MPELRIDPIVGRRVYIAEDRAGRPNDYVGWDEVPPEVELAPLQAGLRPSLRDCFFCAGNEAQTPVASATVLDANGQWRVRVVPNKYPAVVLDQPEAGPYDEGGRESFATRELLRKQRSQSQKTPDPVPTTAHPVVAAFGAHEVIIESPEHVLDVVEMDVEQFAVVLGVYRDRLAHWARDGRLAHAAIFKNSGYDAGASLEHVHSQLVALPFVPAALQAELDGVARFYQSHGRCVFCDLIERETAAGERLVLRQHGYAAICAFAPRQPFETWILPERHRPRFETLEDDELSNQARVLHELLRRLQAASPGVAYNLLLHTAPFEAPAESFHWHWELVPRLTHEAGLEWGGGVFITPLSPERAAERLRGAS